MDYEVPPQVADQMRALLAKAGLADDLAPGDLSVELTGTDAVAILPAD